MGFILHALEQRQIQRYWQRHNQNTCFIPKMPFLLDFFCKFEYPEVVIPLPETENLKIQFGNLALSGQLGLTANGLEMCCNRQYLYIFSKSIHAFLKPKSQLPAKCICIFICALYLRAIGVPVSGHNATWSAMAPNGLSLITCLNIIHRSARLGTSLGVRLR